MRVFMPTNITDSNLEEKISQSTAKVVIIDFWADWCGPCHALAPSLEKLESEYNDSVEVMKLDVDTNPESSDLFQIRGLPTLIVFVNGEPETAITGVVPYYELKAFVAKLI
jgi:thioredoxin 1